VVSDAGMPGISDPGFRVVQIAIENGIPIFTIPGAAAFVSALVASGLPVEPFSFRGFMPAKSGARRKELENIRDSEETNVFYEAPHRIRESIEDIVAVLGAGRRICIARELTKVHEELLRGTSGEFLEIIKNRGELKGEITLLIGPWVDGEVQSAPASIRDRVAEIMREEKLDEKSALKKAAKERGISKSEAYREWQMVKRK
jgi:16S rRNA (cytidine1402-2'-O)-methyltransferase